MPGEKTQPAMQRQSGNAGLGHDACRRCKTERLSFMIEPPQGSPAFDSGRLSDGIVANPIHPPEVNNDSVVAHRRPGNVVAATSHRKRQVSVTRKIDCGHYIGWTRALNNQSGPLVDDTIPNVAGGLVTGIVRQDECSMDTLPKRFNISCVEFHLR
jgi:hypothetical protein